VSPDFKPGEKCQCTTSASDGAWSVGSAGVFGTCKGGEKGCCSEKGAVKCDDTVNGETSAAPPVPTVAPITTTGGGGGGFTPGEKCKCTKDGEGAFTVGSAGVFGTCKGGEKGCCSEKGAVKCDDTVNGETSASPVVPTISVSTSAAPDTSPTASSSPNGSEPYDCDAGYSNWEAGWSAEKKDWCCQEKQMGCAPTTSPPFDCDAGLANAAEGWSDDKKTWCCDNQQKGCDVTTSPPFDCDAGFDNFKLGWSDDKKTWCCDNKQKACEDGAPAATTTAGKAPLPDKTTTAKEGGDKPDEGGDKPEPGDKCECTKGSEDTPYKPGDPGVFGVCKGGEEGCCTQQYSVKCD
jgi:hypothetical protein